MVVAGRAARTVADPRPWRTTGDIPTLAAAGAARGLARETGVAVHADDDCWRVDGPRPVTVRVAGDRVTVEAAGAVNVPPRGVKEWELLGVLADLAGVRVDRR